jgi:TolB-like protein
MSREVARELTGLVGARYVLVGTIDAWSNEAGPEVGLTARLLDPERGTTVWSGSVSLHAVEVPGLLAMGRPRTLPRAARRAARELFGTLSLRRRDGTVRPPGERRARKTFLAQRPIAYRSPAFDGRRQYRVAVMPFDNRSSSSNASPIVADHLTAWLQWMDRIEVVDPGELRRLMVERDMQPYYGLDEAGMRVFAEELGVDAVLDGTILEFDTDTPLLPKIDLYARLRDARTGKILWSATTRREGRETRSFYDVGVVHGIDRLTDEAISDLLSTWPR